MFALMALRGDTGPAGNVVTGGAFCYEHRPLQAPEPSILVIVPFAFVMVFVMSVPVVVVIPTIMSVARDVFVVVPIIAHEVDGSAAGMVLGTMLAPVLLVSRRDVQVDRLD
jgi:hypothetical protein